MGLMIVQTLILWGVWIVLLEVSPGLTMAPGDALIGLPIAVAVAWYAHHLRATSAVARSGRRWRPLSLLALAPRVVWLVLAGGWDVARRAVQRVPDLNPGFVTYRLEVPDARVAVGLSYLLTLMPGTLAERVTAAEIRLHVLDLALPVEAQARALESRLRQGLGGGSVP